MVKTASNNEGEVEEIEEVDELYEAAKKVVAGMGCETEEEECCDEGNLGGDDFAAVSTDDPVEFAGEVEEVSESTGDEKAVECLEDAKDAIEEAVDALGGGNDEVELEVEFEEDVVEDDIVADDGDEEIAVEASDEELAVEASNDNWVKLSAISPKNRKQIYDYWSKQLGYPKDFVKLMVKDYE
jgi:hypothetical protein